MTRRAAAYCNFLTLISTEQRADIASTTMPRTRRQQKTAPQATPMAVKPEVESTSSDDDDKVQPQVYAFDGKEYDTYQDMVNAKRKRNHNVLVQSGLIGLSAAIKEQQAKASQRGIASKKRKTVKKKEPLPRRKSSRLAGVQADNIYIENEVGGRFTISGGMTTPSSNDEITPLPPKPEHYRGRIVEEGAPISIKDAIELADDKWVQEDSVENATKFVSEELSSLQHVNKKRATVKSPTSVVSVDASSLASKIDALSVDDEQNVAKVTPDRIYSVACHPSTDKLIVCAGDKQGYVGMWNVDDASDGDGVHLFRPHGRPVSTLSWTPSGQSLLSASYDGTVRWLDVESQSFQEIFATYDDDVAYRDFLGSGLDEGHKFWTQFVCPDHRNASDQCFFMSTSIGTVVHIDLRIGSNGKITFHEQLSDRKINSLSLHPNGCVLASAGLDCTVKLWDIRKFGDDRNSKGKDPSPLAVQQSGKSVNSAFFSPSGSTLLSTTMSNTLDITKGAHLAKTTKTSLKPTKRIRHDNHTGRWLTTFMAQWHPSADVFVVGSMKKPRCIDLYDSDGNLLRAVEGDALTAVASRCCFHPSQDKLVVVGGNSSGRVTVLR